MNLLENLISFLENKNLNKYASEIYKLAAPAEPFLDWFGGEERVYLPYKSNIEVNEAELRQKHPYILEAAKYMGFELDYVSLYKKSLNINSRSERRVRIALPFYNKFFEKKLNELLESKDDGIKDEFSKKFLNIFWSSSYLTQIPEMIKEFKDNFSPEEFIKIQNDLMNAVVKFKNYDSDDLRESSMSKDEKMVVISRAEEDVLNMSTGRRWTSCMDLHGNHASDIAEKNVYCEVENGGFIAYLTSSDDLDVEEPYSRVLIRRFDSQNTKKSIAIPEENVYGQGDPIFLDIVKSWVKEKQGVIEFDEYKLMGMEYSDEHEAINIFGIPEDMSPDEFIKDPNSIFNYSEKVYLVQDHLAMPILIEEIPEVAKDLELFEGYKILKSKEEVDFLYNYSKDNMSKLKNDILSRIYSSRIEYLDDEIGELAFDLDNGDYVDTKNSNLVDALISWAEEDWGESYDINGKLASDYEGFIEFLNENPNILDGLSEQNHDGLTVNKFDKEKPFYSFEFKVKSILEGKEDRYSDISISKEEYFDNIHKYRPLLYTSMIKSALKFSRETPNGLSKETMEKLKSMKERSDSKKSYVQLVLKNPDNSDQKDLNEIVDTMTESLLLSIKNLIINEKFYNIHSAKRDLSMNFSEVKYFFANSTDESLIKKYDKKINDAIDLLFSSNLVDGDKLEMLNYIIEIFSIKHTSSFAPQIINIDLNKAFDFISGINRVDEYYKVDMKKFKKLMIRSKNVSIENLKKLFKDVSRINIYFLDPDGDSTSTVISLANINKTSFIDLTSEIFLDIISKKENRDALEEEIDNVLEKVSSKINNSIKNYKIRTHNEKNKESHRFFKKYLNLELNAISDFSKKLLNIIK